MFSNINSDMNLWLSRLLQLSDATFPTGSYAHSLGLEGVVQRGLISSPDTLEKYITEIIIPTLAHVDLPFIAHAYRSAAHNDIEALSKLDQQCGAMKGSRELRQACESIGIQRLQMLVRIMDCSLLSDLEVKQRNGDINGYDPIIFGAYCAASSIPIEATATCYYYQSIASLLSASLKLIRIGQTACQRILTDALKKSSQTIRVALAVKIEDIGWFTPTIEIASAQHETTYTRLFIS